MDEVSSQAGGSPGPDAPVRVFMSYRRADDRHFVGRLHDQLCSAFGDQAVFRDIDSIKVGTNFRNVILRTLNEVDAVVAVIGPRWNRAAQAEGDDLDYVFLELAEALRQGKPVVPALVEDTAMPRAELLPEDIRALTGIHAVSVRADPLFRHDCARLVEAVQELVAADRARIAGERLAAAEAVRQAEAAQRERERRAEELRAEEREARMRIAELEEAAARRELERERSRLEAIALRLRQEEDAQRPEVAAPPAADEAPQVEQPPAVDEAPQVDPAPQVDRPPAADEATQADQPPAVDQPTQADEAPHVDHPPEVDHRPAVVRPPEADQSSAVDEVFGRRVEPALRPEADAPARANAGTDAGSGPPTHGAGPVVTALLIAAVVVGAISLSMNRGGERPFGELTGGASLDLAAWIFTLVAAVPLLLDRWPLAQRSVLLGVVLSAVFFNFLETSSVVHFGPTGYTEGAWAIAKLVRVGCLVAAYLLLHRRSVPAADSPDPPPWQRWLLVGAVALSGALMLAALRTQWKRAPSLIPDFVPDRTPFAIWVIGVALGPLVAALWLAIRSSPGDRIALGTFAALAAVNDWAESVVARDVFGQDGSFWLRAAWANVFVATIAWLCVPRRGGRPVVTPDAAGTSRPSI